MIRKQGILAHIYYQYIVIVTTFFQTINSLLFVEYVKLCKALRGGNKYMERTEQIIEVLSFKS